MAVCLPAGIGLPAHIPGLHTMQEGQPTGHAASLRPLCGEPRYRVWQPKGGDL